MATDVKYPNYYGIGMVGCTAKCLIWEMSVNGSSDYSHVIYVGDGQ